MPKFFIRTVNHSWVAKDDGAEYADLTHARQQAIANAAGIAFSELGTNRSVIVEGLVEDESCAVLAKVAVAICVGDLMIEDRSET